ncbi:nitroreductase [Dactylosporangium sp. NPDC048998]|uniref:nitroreductase n=1 Tax=Dactylosporangium sp. NPDC048998 TaxID=3363976 RepID=UPI0037160D40
MSGIPQQAPLSAGDVLYEAARVACLAPSIEDSQPWLWRIRGTTLELRADRSRQLTSADPQGRLMTISCGAVLHHATVVLAVLGAAATVERIDDPADPDLLAVLTLTGPHEVTAEEMRLHHALRTRCTDRRPFRGIAALPDEVLALLHRAAEPFAVNMHAVAPSQVDFPGFAASSAAAPQAASWMIPRMPPAREGVPTRAAVPKVTRTGPLHEQGRGEDRYTTYLAFTTAHDTRADWLRTGEAISAVLLTATTVGLASSVMSDPVEPLGGAPAGHGQLTIRLGVNESAPAAPSTPRRPRDEVIDVVPTS